MSDLLEETLKDAFDRAHDAPLWAAPVWTDPIQRVERAAGRARSRRAVAAAAGLALVAGGTVAAVRAIPAHEDRILPADGAADGPAAGATGAQWLLTPKQYDAYTAAHPSPSPSVERVPSPAPPDGELTQLQADVGVAVPDARTVRADAADGGVRGDATVWLRLSDGTPLAVERVQLDYPRVLSTTTSTASTEQLAPEHFTEPQTWADGTAYTVVTGQAWGYGMGENTQWSGPFVWTVTPDGWFTMWTAPVSADTLLGWAHAADAHAAGG